jgi:hypothetical protein
METNRTKNRLAPPIVLIVAAVLLLSCGGGGEKRHRVPFAAGWLSEATEHVTVYEPPDSPRIKWLASFAQDNEDLLIRLCDLMKLDVPEHVAIYRFVTNQDCESATGHSAGYVEDFNIYTRIGAPMGGAIAMAAFSTVGPEPPAFPLILDGFREAFDHPTDNLHRKAFELQAEGREIPLTELMAMTEITDREAYDTQCASFVAYLIQRHGIDKFKMLWRSALELEPSLEKIYGGTLEQIEADWAKHMEREAKKS